MTEAPHSPLDFGISLNSREYQYPHNENYRPEMESSLTSSSEEETDRTGGQEPKVIVYQSCVLELFKMCQTCGSPINSTDISYFGAQMRVKWDCLKGHNGTWTSSPEIHGMPEVDLLVASAVLFTGATITELEDMSKVMNLKVISPTTFCGIQKAYLFPAIEQLYTLQRDQILERASIKQNLQLPQPPTSSEEVGEMHQPLPKLFHLSGNGRHDTFGSSSKYCCYTFTMDDTKEIIQTNLVQVTEISSSVAMEAEAFRHGLEAILDTGLKVGVVSTDRSPSIRRIMQEEYPRIKHQFDVLHTAKSFHKKMLKAARKRGQGPLADWAKYVINHMWFSSASCGANSEELVRRWLGILHHVTDVHSWTTNGEEQHCLHPQMSDGVRKKKKWLERGSLPYKVLSNLVQDKHLLRDFENMELFMHTGALEVFHSAVLKYMPKRQCPSYHGIRERGLLAVLEHNENIVKRRPATTKEGGLKMKQFFCQRTNQWAMKVVYQPHTHNFRQRLLEIVMAQRQDPTLPY
ncbi:uncharacterized protein LOC130129568 [Lampris incognitus]|uniref:uncharacterized protein LOC130129568 n=1 Tax=Lampris incognitus TaxID=2546036 RepID=UPI0024B63247|nr:uncharacterized protein LOC130129568 [Lampris incognitus]